MGNEPWDLMRTFGVPPRQEPPADLAVNRPGQAARLRADLEWQKRRTERPVRSLLARAFDAHTDERAWRMGAAGEELVAIQLARLSLYEADRASRLLSAALGARLPVWGVIVPVNSRDVRVKALAPGVSVIPRMRLFKWMRRMPQVLTVEQIETIYAAARRPTTWQH